MLKEAAEATYQGHSTLMREGHVQPEDGERIEKIVEAARARSHQRFTQVYAKGWQTLRAIGENQAALRVYTFIAEHCDHLNALVCATELMAEHLKCSDRTIRRATKWLEDNHHVVVVKIGTANAYILDPSDLWKNYDKYKDYCGFSARTLASKRANAHLKRRITLMLERQAEEAEVTQEGERDLFGSPLPAE